MMSFRGAFAATLLVALTSTFVQGQDELFGLHGSGTTNPSKCFWILMNQIEDRSRLPLKLSYRAVGSSTGVKEFAGADNAYAPYNDFGAGDIPVPQDVYDSINADADNGGEMLHFPFALGAISIFHSIPGVPSGKGGLNMTSCLIAKIFDRRIIHWDHEDILAVNPSLKDYLPSDDYPINLAHRVKGSSSTASVTKYLTVSCPDEWPDDTDHVGSTISWPPAGDHVFECEGSGGMTTCIRDNEGTIGYIDSGHGHSENLVEIELENADGTVLSSKEAADANGIASAADNTALPSELTASFASVDFLNKGGEFTWPIVAMTYVYVRQDITHIDSPVEQGLLKAWLRTLYDEDSFADCTQFGFTAAPPSIQTKALTAIDNIVTSAGAPEFTFEKSTDAGKGQGPYVISVKRRSGTEYQLSTLEGAITDTQNSGATLMTSVEDLQEEVSALTTKVTALEENAGNGNDSGGSTPSTGMSVAERNELNQLKNELELLNQEIKAVGVEVESMSGSLLNAAKTDDEEGNEFTDKHESQLQAALVMSAIAIVLWGAAVVGLLAKRVLGL
mmetsp:Transcript_1512/g.2108  ORF Transcript_1512/g.2108 Transcript_1512/m.2108 type:complete len:561 (-) Transcript_1512:769-2451(-)